MEAKKIIEAALFMSPKAISFQELLRLVGSISVLRQALTELASDYRERDSVLQVMETSQGYQMKVRSEYEAKVSHLAASSEFSKSVLKTLAFIAFKQPLKQADLIKYRTNKAYDDVKLLVEEGFVSKQPEGRTFILRTTKKFLSYFGENSVILKKSDAP